MHRFPPDHRRRRGATIMVVIGVVGLTALGLDWLPIDCPDVLVHPLAALPGVVLAGLGASVLNRPRGRR